MVHNFIALSKGTKNTKNAVFPKILKFSKHNASKI